MTRPLSHVLVVLLLALALGGCGGAIPQPATAPPSPATTAPTAAQSSIPSSAPSSAPTIAPTSIPTPVPTSVPTSVPTAAASSTPTATASQPAATATRTAVPRTATTAPSPRASATSKAALSTSTPGASAGAGYEGDWEGRTSTDSPILFTVTGNQITSVNLNYFIATGTCQGLSGSRSTSMFGPDAPTIQGKDWKFQKDDGIVTVAGSFASPTEASGTFQVKDKSSFCGDYDLKGTWTAKLKPAQPATATVEPKPTASSAENERLLRGFFDAINAKKVDEALKRVDEDVIYSFGTTGGIGKAALKTYLQGQVSKGVTYTLSNVEVDEDLATFSLAGSSDNTVFFGDGLIQILTLK